MQSQLDLEIAVSGTQSASLFYRYARRRAFLKSFSVNNLFANNKDVDDEWLDTLEQEADQHEYALGNIFFFGWFLETQLDQVSGKKINQPDCGCCSGSEATGIGRSKQWDDAQERIQTYAQQMPNCCERKHSWTQRSSL